MRISVAASVTCFVAAAGLASCAQTDALVARDTTGSIFGGDDAGEGGIDANTGLRCATSECPAPFASCGAGFPCTTDLSSDEQNCGACNNVCPSFDPLFMRGRCVEGACVLVCFADDQGGAHQERRDCNHSVDDGCEADVFSDERNCGTCGNVCPAGVRCILGRCGCLPPLVDCDGRCEDLATSLANCGTCGHACTDTCFVPGTMPTCRGGTCSAPECFPSFFDCNGDLDKGCESDGCEVIVNTVENCGACGVACAPGTECRDDGAGLKCLPKSPPGTPGGPGDPECPYDLLSDPHHCGACGVACPEPRAHELVTCEKGVCVTRCDVGFADCNGNPSDGCEVDLVHDPAHCGSCEERCLGPGQPCIEGKCLTKDCDPGGAQ